MDVKLADIDDSDRIVAEVRRAGIAETPLAIRGGNSKSFLGRKDLRPAQVLDTSTHRGILRYEPTELVLTARAGTPLSEISKLLADNNQSLPCEPPEFNGRATLGGAVATGLSGPRRPWSGAVRDFVLGCRLVTADAKQLRFGGEVMKNVAGFDVSRLMTGSFGSLGVLTEVSVKVLPRPRANASISIATSAEEAMTELLAWRKAALPVSGACYFDGRLQVRLEGGEGSVQSALERIGGERLADAFWIDLREMRLPFFQDPRPLWRLSLPAGTPLISMPGSLMLDWGGAQRWLKTDAPPPAIFDLARALGGHATQFTCAPANGTETGCTTGPFAVLPPALESLHRAIKQRLDPHGLFNPGRLYADF